MPTKPKPMHEADRVWICVKNCIYVDCIQAYLANSYDVIVSSPLQKLVDNYDYGLVLLDIILLTESDVVKISQKFYGCIILLVQNFSDPRQRGVLALCLDNDIDVYIDTAKADLSDLKKALEAAKKGYEYNKSNKDQKLQLRALVDRMRRGLPQTPESSETTPVLPRPTTRHLDLIRLLRKEYSNQQIATELGISLHTVKNHIVRMLEVYGAEDRRQLVEIADKNGWF